MILPIAVINFIFWKFYYPIINIIAQAIVLAEDEGKSSSNIIKSINLCSMSLSYLSKASANSSEYCLTNLAFLSLKMSRRSAKKSPPYLSAKTNASFFHPWVVTSPSTLSWFFTLPLPWSWTWTWTVFVSCFGAANEVRGAIPVEIIVVAAKLGWTWSFPCPVCHFL